MVGFNSETEKDFSQTVDLAKLLNLQINMVIPFSEKFNTKAATIPEKISVQTKNERHKFLFDIVKNMKVKLFRKELFDLDKNERENILNKIKVAENYSVLVD